MTTSQAQTRKIHKLQAEAKSHLATIADLQAQLRKAGEANGVGLGGNSAEDLEKQADELQVTLQAV